MIHHCSESLAATIAAYRDLLTTWRSEERDVVLVISLALIEGERVASLSLYGHIQHILDWLLRSEPFPPAANRDHG